MSKISTTLFSLFLLISCNKEIALVSDHATNDYKATVSGLSGNNITTTFLNYSSDNNKGDKFSFYIDEKDLLSSVFKDYKNQNKKIDSLNIEIEISSTQHEKVSIYNAHVVNAEAVDFYLAKIGNNTNWVTELPVYGSVSDMNQKKQKLFYVILQTTKEYGGRVSIQRKGLTFNPGPPETAPAIKNNGINLGWIHKHDARTGDKGIEINLQDFCLVEKEGLFQIDYIRDSKASKQIESLISNQDEGKQLILVLANKNTKKYEEIKLRDAKILSKKGIGNRILLSLHSNDIVILK